MHTQVAGLVFILSGMLNGAPLHSEETDIVNTNYLQNYFIDGIEESKLPYRYRDIAMMCDVFKKLNAFRSGDDSKSSGMHGTANLTPIISEDNYSNKVTDTDTQQRATLAENVKEYLKELTSDAGADNENMDQKLIDSEQAPRKERVKRNNSNLIPQELLQMLQGVCVTDECLQVVREYFEWRRQNGYPVYTGVSQIG